MAASESVTDSGILATHQLAERRIRHTPGNIQSHQRTLAAEVLISRLTEQH